MSLEEGVRKSLGLLFLTLVVGTAVFFIYQREKAIREEFQDMANAHEARYYEPLANRMVQCSLCPSRCVLSAGEWGLCKARRNIQGKL